MKIKGFWHDIVLTGIAAAVAAIFIVITAFIEPRLALAECCGFVAVLGFALLRALTAKNRYKKFLLRLSKKFDYTDTKVLSSFPLPVAVCSKNGTIVWGSERFLNEITGREISNSTDISEFTNGVDIDTLIHEEETSVLVKDRYYSVYSFPYRYNGDELCILYYLENTRLKKTEIAYVESRPYAVMIEMDNLDDSRTDFRDSERTEIKSQIEAALDNWSESCNSFIKRVGDDRYLMVTEQKNFSRMVEDRFSILETVRGYEYKGKKTGVTLSIGVSAGDNIKQCEKNARNALEMALGRGGDQVAIKNKESYDFIGGVSKSAEKRTKVKSRIVASALAELIKGSSNVLVMGHAYTDLDAIGAAAGVVCAAQSFGVPAFIVTDRNKTLASSLVEMLGREGMDDVVIGKDKASELLGKKTLLIVVDTHIESFVEFPKLYEKAETRVIIDHHRRAVSNIENAVIFHHDPGASSASEMVAEILQYINPDIEVTKPVAEALLAGIMLDTKNFVIRAGVRTFEAAAYLKDKGADTVSVKKLFANSMDINKMRNKVIASAESFMSCAVSTADFDSQDIRIIAAQAADELLNVSDIKASFVLFENAGAVNISARSMGEVNVQIIMETLGGGGHQTMAACQLKGYDIPDAKSALYKAIEEFFKNNAK